MKTKKTFVFLAIMALVIMPLFVFAVDPALNPIGHIDPVSGAVIPTGTGGTPLNATIIPDKIMQAVNWFAWFITVASVVMGLYAGFLFITARGDASQLKTARQTIIWAVVGIAVAIVSFSIINITSLLLV